MDAPLPALSQQQNVREAPTRTEAPSRAQWTGSASARRWQAATYLFASQSPGEWRQVKNPKPIPCHHQTVKACLAEPHLTVPVPNPVPARPAAALSAPYETPPPLNFTAHTPFARLSSSSLPLPASPPHPHDGHALARVDLVGRDGMAVEVAHALDLVVAPVQLHLVRLHHL